MVVVPVHVLGVDLVEDRVVVDEHGLARSRTMLLDIDAHDPPMTSFELCDELEPLGLRPPRQVEDGYLALLDLLGGNSDITGGGATTTD